MPKIATKAMELVNIERQEQINKHARSIEHDKAQNANGELVLAAQFAVYLLDKWYPKNWSETYKAKLKAKSHLERYVIACALYIAEEDRVGKKMYASDIKYLLNKIEAIIERGE